MPKENPASAGIIRAMGRKNDDVRRPPELPLTAWATAVLAIVWLPLAATRLHDPDEYEHLHAAYSVAAGQVPYRDFFEHHGPLTYLLLAGPVRWLGPTPWLLEIHRFCSVLCLIAAVAATRRLAAPPGGAKVGWLAAAALASWCWFAEKGIEGRPDVPALALGTWALVLLAARPAAGPAFAAGLLFGLATLFTQKASFLALGAGVGLAWTLIARRVPWLRALLAYAAGGAAPWCLAWAGFAALGAGPAFLRGTVLTPLTWPAHAARADEGLVFRVVNFLGWSPGHVGLAAAGLLWGLLRLRRRHVAARGDAVAACAAAGHLAGLALTPAAYLQYYLLALPALAATAALALAPCWRRRPGTLAALALAACGGLHGLRQALGEGFQREAGPFAWLALGDMVFGAAAAVAALVGLALARQRRYAARWAVAAAFGLLALVSVSRTVFQLCCWQRAAAERELIARIAALPPADGTFQDGFSGLGCLRPHASYWWWVNHHSLPLIARSGGLPDLLAGLVAARPAFVSLDADFLAFARRYPEVEAALARRYRPLDGRTPIAERIPTE